jgi:predicted amidophosphoribosyltransferase
MMSLPDELAQSVERQIGIPFLPGGLRNTATDIELRGLTWSQRRHAVRGSMEAGDLGIAAGRSVLVIDDVITSGATLREASRLLLGAGALEIYGLGLCHTEG